MTDIFLSYSSKDRERVRPIRDALAAAGYSVFWDQETPTGVNWNRWIMEKLGEARLVIVAWSHASATSDPVIHEASIGREDGKLMPCLLDELKTRDMPMGFYTTQAAALHDWSGQSAHKGFLDLMQAVHARLKSGGAAAPAQKELAQSERDKQSEIATLWKHANAGEAWAQFNLGNRYRLGKDVLQNDWEAVRYYKLAADQGIARAQQNLGWMYQSGRGVAQDDAEAARLYRLAADQLDAGAQTNLGWMYQNGCGVTQDDAEAVRLYKLAADQGYPNAQHNLGVMYENGLGVAQDKTEAVRLYKLAADQGNESAIDILKRLGQ
jgi:hypothetical protein